MRVLLTTTAGLGHLHPMIPLARALTARGHDVVWAGPADVVDHIERAGIRAVSTAPAGNARPAEALRRYPELAALPPAERGDVMFGKLFGTIAAPPMLEGLAPVAMELQPHLVLSDAAELAGPIVAAELGVPGVTKGFGPILPAVRMARAADDVAPLWRSRGLEPRPYCGAYDHLYIDIYPPEMQLAVGHVPHRQLMRPVSEDSEVGTGPTPLPGGDPEAPLVYLTLGTVFNDPGPLQMAARAMAGLDVRAVVTVGPHADPAVLGEQPPHVRVERYVPQAQLLPSCAVVVSHAGSGTMLSSLALGIPQLCLPQGADQFLNASALASAGAGIVLVPGQADEGAVRAAVERLLREPQFRDAARRVGESIGAMPSPADVAEVLERLVT